MTVDIQVINSGNTIVEGAHVHVDWEEAGLPSGSDDGYTDSTGFVHFSESWSLFAHQGAIQVTNFLDYGTGTVTGDQFGDGSAKVQITFNPLGILNSIINTIGSWVFWIIVIVAIVVILVIVLTTGGRAYLAGLNPVGDAASITDKAKGYANKIKNKVKK